jgi:sulfur-carrier protein adenylyltransferase/sulfurtransferase
LYELEKDTEMTKEELNRYNRHIILTEIGIEGQLKMKKASVLVIGAGGLGCPVLQYLTAAGVGKIGIADNDTVSESNLQRQVLYSQADIGKLKVEIAKQSLSKQNPLIEIATYAEKISTNNILSIAQNYDILVDATDNFPTRYLLNDASVILGKPLVFASIFKFEGQVSVFNLEQSATYRCLYPEPPAPEDAPACNEVGVLGVLPGIIGLFQANEVLKIILGLGDVLQNKLLNFNALSLEFSLFSFSKNPKNLKIFELNDNYDFFCGLQTSGLSKMSASELKEVIFDENDIQLIDVRTASEYNQYNIGGFNFCLENLSEYFHRMEPNKKIILVCKTGQRSKKAAQILQNQMPYLHFFYLENGLDGF